MEKPILFSAPMVRALLAGTKTQTRRILKPQPKGGYKAWRDESSGEWFTSGYGEAGDWGPHSVRFAVGDQLWVRETWAEHHPAGIQPERFSMPGRAGIPGPPGVSYRVIYRADGDPVRVWHCDSFPYRTTNGPRDDISARHPDVCSEFPGWTPSVHMPRWASRLTLTVTDVRVQRLQDITEEDAKAEGVALAISGRGDDGIIKIRTHRTGFVGLWQEINGNWLDNPWVVALTFTVERRNIDAMAA